MTDPRIQEKQRRQREALDHVRATGSIEQALANLKIPRASWDRWHATDRRFALQSAEALQSGKEAKKFGKIKADDIYDPDRENSPPPGIVDFRWSYLGRPTWPHQIPIVEAWEDQTNHTIIVLGPPGMGKDTTAGDILLRESLDRTLRLSWIMESGPMSERRLGRLERYYWDTRAYDMQPDGPGCQMPTHKVPDDYGHFRWKPELRYPNGDKVEQPRWTKNELYFLGRDLEADPNLWATGMGGALYGARIDKAILSDIFTAENQVSFTEREKQWSWLNGTFLTRLDDAGRVMFLLTRVSQHDNAGRLLNEFTADAEVISQNGYYTKYDNGVATVIIPAIQTNAEGEEVSYWPERFPLDPSLHKDGVVVSLEGLTKERYRELAADGYKRDRGLREFRRRAPALFAAMAQQQPLEGANAANFTDPILDGCDDPKRTYGVRTPGSALLLGVDPATVGGAAWWLWELHGGVFTLIDEFYGENIGTVGLREKLLVDPITRWRPRWAVYEDNREASVLEHPQVMSAARNSATQIVKFHTHAHNRGEKELGVAGMVIDMVEGKIKWPTATQADRDRTNKVKQQFRNWDIRNRARVEGRPQPRIEDDLPMAGWVGWRHARKMAQGSGKVAAPGMRVAASVARRFGGKPRTPESVSALTPSEQVAAYYENR